MVEWRIAGPSELFLKNDSSRYVYHNHDNYLFTCALLKNGIACGLCGKLVPDYIKLQLKLLGSIYDHYLYNPRKNYVICCVYENKRLVTSLTKNGYWLNTPLGKVHTSKLKDLYEKYRDIWQDILL